MRSALDAVLPGRGRAAQTMFEEYASMIATRYSEPHRAYHTLQHVGALLHLRDVFEKDIVDKDAVTLAILFHDVVYDVGVHVTAGENERKSALGFEHFFADVLDAYGKDGNAELPTWVSVATRSKVVEWIMATANHFAAHVRDMDIAILGSDKDVYEGYCKAVRVEYAYVSSADFARGRSAFLRTVQTWGTFAFKTPVARARFGANLERNVAWELDRLMPQRFKL